MTNQPIRLHGYTHAAGGQDPIPSGSTGIFFDTENGPDDYLHISVDGFHVPNRSQIQFSVSGNSGSPTFPYAPFFVDCTGVVATSNVDVRFLVEHQMRVTGTLGHSGIIFSVDDWTDGSVFEVEDTGITKVSFAGAGTQTFRVMDSASHALLTAKNDQTVSFGTSSPNYVDVTGYGTIGVTGRTGATSQMRVIGATAATSPPASGTWVTGDFAVGQGGAVFVCTAGGTPGTWATLTATGSALVFGTNTGTTVTINTTASGGIVLDDQVNTTGTGVAITSDHRKVVITGATGAQLNTGSTQVSTGTAGAFAILASGLKFEIQDSSNNPILRVTESGTFHILSGASWVADL